MVKVASKTRQSPRVDIRTVASAFILVSTAVLPGTSSFADTPANQKPDTEAHLFSEKCSGCHTIGKGRLVGPDLQEVTSWSTSDIETNVKRMQKMVGPLSDEEVKGLTTFMKDVKAKDRLKAENERATAVQAQSEPASSDVGRDLFLGMSPLTNGGPSCIACHSVEGHGGTMGKELTDAYEKMGEAALVSVIEEPSYPVMRQIYHVHPATKREALDITKYLASLQGSKSKQAEPHVAELGFLGSIACLGGLMFFYRNRNKAVRSRLDRSERQ